MKSDWILDVLTDLKTFARANGMTALAEQLDDTAIVAMAEIAMVRESQYGDRLDTDGSFGAHFGKAGASRHA